MILSLGYRMLIFSLAAGFLTACGASQTPVAASNAAPLSHDTTGTIYWSKQRLHLKYPSASHGQAVLTYWAPNGYFTYGPTCDHGSQVRITTHRHWGNPSAYMHVVYWFKALNAGPDDCYFTAILNNTGSPPLSTITLQIAP